MPVSGALLRFKLLALFPQEKTRENKKHPTAQALLAGAGGIVVVTALWLEARYDRRSAAEDVPSGTL